MVKQSSLLHGRPSIQTWPWLAKFTVLKQTLHWLGRQQSSFYVIDVISANWHFDGILQQCPLLCLNLLSCFDPFVSCGSLQLAYTRYLVGNFSGLQTDLVGLASGNQTWTCVVSTTGSHSTGAPRILRQTASDGVTGSLIFPRVSITFSDHHQLTYTSTCVIHSVIN